MAEASYPPPPAFEAEARFAVVFVRFVRVFAMVSVLRRRSGAGFEVGQNDGGSFDRLDGAAL